MPLRSKMAGEGILSFRDSVRQFKFYNNFWTLSAEALIFHLSWVFLVTRPFHGYQHFIFFYLVTLTYEFEIFFLKTLTLPLTFEHFIFYEKTSQSTNKILIFKKVISDRPLMLNKIPSSYSLFPKMLTKKKHLISTNKCRFIFSTRDVRKMI